VIMTIMVVVVIVVVGMGALGCGFKGALSRVRLRECFEGVGRAQRFTFRARRSEPTSCLNRAARLRIGLRIPMGSTNSPTANDSGLTDSGLRATIQGREPAAIATSLIA